MPPGTPGSTDAVVELVEPLGQTTNVYLQSGSARYILVTDRTDVQAGDRVGVVAPKEHVRAVALDGTRIGVDRLAA